MTRWTMAINARAVSVGIVLVMLTSAGVWAQEQKESKMYWLQVRQSIILSA